MLIRALLNLHISFGDDFAVECPTDSGRQLNLYQVAREISDRLTGTFLKDADGHQPVHGGQQVIGMGIECGGEGVQVGVHEGVQAPGWVSNADQDQGGLAMSDYLPDVYVRFRERYPGVAQSLDALGEATQDAGGPDARS